MKNIICSRNGATAGFQVSNVSNEEFYLVGNLRILGLVLVTHVVLLFLVAGEDSDFRYVNYCLLICISIASGLSDAKVSASLTTRAR